MTESPLRRLMVGVDDADAANNAVLAAFALQRQTKADVDIVHVVADTSALRAFIPDMPSETDLIEAHRHRLAERIRGLVAESAPEAAYALDVVHGRPADALADLAGRRRADVVFLGPHQKRFLFDFGSTLRSFFARATTPVWLQTGPPRPIRRILVPTDLAPQVMPAVERSCALARGLGAEVELLHCFVPPEFAYPSGSLYVVDTLRKTAKEQFDGLVERLRSEGVKLSGVHFVDSEPQREIAERASQCDLVAIGSHGRTGLPGLLLGNVAYWVMKHVETPVLAWRIEA